MTCIRYVGADASCDVIALFKYESFVYYMYVIVDDDYDKGAF